MDSWPDTTFAYTDTPLPFLYFAMQFSIRNGYADVVCNVAFFIGCCACLPPTFSPHRTHTHTHLPHSTPHGICIYSRLIIHWNQFHLKFDFLSYSTVVPFILWLAFWMRFDLVFHARYANWQARILSEFRCCIILFHFILCVRCAKNMKSENLDARWSIKTIQAASMVLIYTRCTLCIPQTPFQCLPLLSHQTLQISIYFTVIFIYLLGQALWLAVFLSQLLAVR